MNHIGYLLLGLGNGAVYAALATALVVTYRSSGVINFATGSIGLYAAYTYGYLREGDLLLLAPGLPVKVGIGFTPGFWVATLLSLVMASLFGLLLYALVFRPLRNAPPVARVVASIGVQLAIVLLVVQRLGTKPLIVEPVFPQSTFKLGQTVIRTDRLWFAATVILVAVVLGALFRYTRFGVATRAAAETEKGAFVSRISPTRIAALNWMLSSVVAGIAGILIAPLVSLVPIAYSLFIVPALAAAVLSRFDHLAPAVLGGLLIGALQSEAEYLKVAWDWFPQSGVPEMIPLVMILLVLVLKGKPLPERGALIQRTLGRAPRPRHPLITTAVAFAVASVLMIALDGRWRDSLILSFILAIITLSFVVVTGYCGQISLAQLTLAGAAAYTLSMVGTDWGVPFPIAPLLSAAFATLLGVIIGLPALRVRGLSVAVVTLALAVALDAVWFRNLDIVGTAGSVTIDQPSLFGLDLGWSVDKDADHLLFGFMVLIVLAAVGFGIATLRRSSLGSAMVAVRANERSAAASGVSVVRVKLLAFAISSFVAGLGGTLLGYRYGTLTYDQFTPLAGLALFTTVYLAGITSVQGGINAGIIGITGIVYQILNEWVDLGSWYELITAALLLVTVILNPEGLVGPNHVLADRLVRRWGAARHRSDPDRSDPDRSDSDLAATVHSEPTIERPPSGNRPVVLELEQVSIHYGGVLAVAAADLTVPEGTIVGLIGPNGAGKTTLVDAISGFKEHTGTIELSGRSLDGLRPHERVRLGMARTFQAIELYDDLTVEENLEVGLSGARASSRHQARSEMDRLVHVLDIDSLRDQPAGDLSQGQRQLVSIGRALAAGPELLLLDEPAAGLDSAESLWLGERLRAVRDTGVTIVMVDHDVNLVLSLCDLIYVLDFGVVISSGAPDGIRNDPKVIDAYLGARDGAAV